MAVYSVALKYLFSTQDFYTIFIWVQIVGFMAFFQLLSFRPLRGSLVTTYKATSRKIGVILVAEQAVAYIWSWGHLSPSDSRVSRTRLQFADALCVIFKVNVNKKDIRSDSIDLSSSVLGHPSGGKQNHVVVRRRVLCGLVYASTPKSNLME